MDWLFLQFWHYLRQNLVLKLIIISIDQLKLTNKVKEIFTGKEFVVAKNGRVVRLYEIDALLYNVLLLFLLKDALFKHFHTV